MNSTPSEQARDAGISLVTINAGEWMPRALDLYREYCEQTRNLFTMDDFRAWALLWNLPPPHHVNAWGALARIGDMAGYAVKVGQTRKAVRRPAHARQLPIRKSLVYSRGVIQ